MKIATTTFHGAINYGAALQAYSLVRHLNDIGHDARVLDYWPDHRVAANRVWIRGKGMSPGVLAMNALSAAHYRALSRKLRRFAEFREHYLPRTAKTYAKIDQIRADPPEVECYITGSDQVWNPATGIDEVYFLAFAREQQRRAVAYAPSIGLPALDPVQTARMAPLISQIDYLSSREHRGSELIQQLTGRTARTVVDPVFLQDAEAWRRIIPAIPQPEPYILVYAVRRRAELEQAVRRIKAQTGLRVIQIPGTNPLTRGFMPSDTVAWDAGPLEFLRLISGATCVLTNSFHGTAFSVIFGKPFLSFSHTAGDTRAGSILARCGLSKRLVRLGDEAPDIFSAGETEWGTLNAEISQSRAFLNDAILGQAVS